MRGATAVPPSSGFLSSAPGSLPVLPACPKGGRITGILPPFEHQPVYQIVTVTSMAVVREATGLRGWMREGAEERTSAFIGVDPRFHVPCALLAVRPGAVAQRDFRVFHLTPNRTVI